MSRIETLTLDDLCAATGKPASWWRRNWLRMHQRHNFPRRLPGLWAWPKAAVDLWVRLGGADPALPSPANQNHGPDDLDQATSFLEQRFGIGRV